MDTGFFKWVWRFNALVIAAVTSFVCFMLLTELAREQFRQQRAPQTINVDPSDKSVEESFEIGSLSFNEDNRLIEFPLLRPQAYDAGVYASGRGKSTYNNTVNRGFLDHETGETRWLLDHSDGLVVDWQLITRGDAESPISVAVFLRWITSDTNGDRRLSASDSGAVYMFEPGGQNLTLLADNIEDMAREFTFDEEIEVISLQRKGQRELAFVSLPNRSVEKFLALPTPEP